MSDPMQEIRASFFVECDELLEELQDGLEALSDGAGDKETINVVFRAVHSIKGGAGAFGLDDLVAFAHTFETAMDEVRSDRLVAGPDELRLFFSCGDVLADLVHAARDEKAVSDDVVKPLHDKLVELVGEPDSPEEAEAVPDFAPMTIDLDIGGDGEGEGNDLEAFRSFEISFTPTPELFKSGNEPLFILRALADLGQTEITCSHIQLPTLQELSPQASFLSWNIQLEAPVSDLEVEEVFEFVEGLCILEIVSTGPEPESDAAPDLPAEADDQPEQEPVEVSATATPSPLAAKPAPDKADDASKAAAGKPKATVRVDLDRIDRLVNLVGELVINQSMLSQSLTEIGLGPNTQVATGLDEFLQLTRDIQESVMMIRAQPVKSLFQRMARIVRESSADVEKDVRFKTEGEATEIDKTVIERLADPLTHMIRNAVDHGLEPTEKRVESGKSSQGTITLSAAHRSGRVVIEISDDGGGINRPKVKQIAEEKGLIAPDQALSDSEIDNLLFLPGFSTASEISNLSGRGVGMDVVRNSITALGGRIAITSETGRGSTFSISLPLTLAVLDGMIVRVAGETLVVPLGTIAETLSLEKENIRPLSPGNLLVQVRDQFVPLLDLGSALGYRAPLDDYTGSIVLLLAHEDGSRAALIVDGIEDQRQVVIKGLQESYGRVPGVAAATILGDGQIALILDPSDLIANSARRDAAPTPMERAM